MMRKTKLHYIEWCEHGAEWHWIVFHRTPWGLYKKGVAASQHKAKEAAGKAAAGDADAQAASC
jgi:hypothetical protein